MTALDRAFIKAYSQKWRRSDSTDVPQQRAPNVTPAPVSERAQTAEDCASTSSGISLGLSARSTEHDTAGWEPKAIYQFDYSDLAEVSRQHRWPGDEDCEAKPLNTYIAEGLGAALRPRLEVDAFQWPDVCCQLQARLGSEIERLAVKALDGAASGQKLLVITGLRRREGRTTVGLLLAQALARLSENIALLDADFANPEIATQLGVAVDAGWEHVLSGELELADIMIKSLTDRLVLVPLATGAKDAASGASRLKTSAVTRTLRDQCDLVVLDAGPLGVHGELGAPLGSLDSIGADAAYLIYGRRLTSLEEILPISHQVTEAGIIVGGIIENFGGGARRGHVSKHAATPEVERED